MFYYIDTIEQVKKKDEQGQVIEGINEYGKREICKDEKDNALPYAQVQSKYFKKLSDVSADLVEISESKNHYYMNIRIVNSTGGILEEKTLGQYQEANQEVNQEAN